MAEVGARRIERVRVKICGLTRAAHGVAAARLGADYLGFVFVPGTRRYLEPGQAREVIAEIRAALEGSGPHPGPLPGGERDQFPLPPRRERVRVRVPAYVGLFADESPAFVNRVAEECGLDCVQLSGDETAAYCRQIARPVFRSLRPRDEADLGLLDAFSPVVERIVLDTYHGGALGGTGLVGDWDLAARAAARYPLLLAGGLTPDNVAAAVRAVRPWGVDVSSGVETDGVKDVEKIGRFIAAAKLG